MRGGWGWGVMGWGVVEGWSGFVGWLGVWVGGRGVGEWGGGGGRSWGVGGVAVVPGVGPGPLGRASRARPAARRSFYVYAGILALLNLVQGLGSAAVRRHRRGALVCAGAGAGGPGRGAQVRRCSPDSPPAPSCVGRHPPSSTSAAPSSTWPSCAASSGERLHGRDAGWDLSREAGRGPLACATPPPPPPQPSSLPSSGLGPVLQASGAEEAEVRVESMPMRVRTRMPPSGWWLAGRAGSERRPVLRTPAG